MYMYELIHFIRGFYPKGGGIVNVRTQPLRSLVPITLTDLSEVTRIFGLAYVAGVLPKKVWKSLEATILKK